MTNDREGGRFRLRRYVMMILSCACLAALCAPLCAEMREFDALSLDVPPGWTAEQQGATIVMKDPGSDASLSLASGKMGSASLGEIARKLYEQLGGVDLEEDESGDFYFEYRDTAGVPCGVWVCDGGGGEYAVIAFSGDDQAMSGVIERILDSVSFIPAEDGETGEDEEDEDDEGGEDEEWEDAGDE